eukprot:SAG31_NODE_598_length_13651_cov_10.681818_3_plen_263_part_00
MPASCFRCLSQKIDAKLAEPKIPWWQANATSWWAKCAVPDEIHFEYHAAPRHQQSCSSVPRFFKPSRGDGVAGVRDAGRIGQVSGNQLSALHTSFLRRARAGLGRRQLVGAVGLVWDVAVKKHRVHLGVDIVHRHLKTEEKPGLSDLDLLRKPLDLQRQEQQPCGSGLSDGPGGVLRAQQGHARRRPTNSMSYQALVRDDVFCGETGEHRCDEALLGGRQPVQVRGVLRQVDLLRCPQVGLRFLVHLPDLTRPPGRTGQEDT